jgi:hypothetical protein
MTDVHTRAVVRHTPALAATAVLGLLPLLAVQAMPGASARADLQPATWTARHDTTASMDNARADAVHHFREGRYTPAYAAFARLADAGDARAARIALLMAQEGRLLFEHDWYLPPGQQQRWSVLARPRSVATGSASDADRRQARWSSLQARPADPTLPRGDLGE